MEVYPTELDFGTFYNGERSSRSLVITADNESSFGYYWQDNPSWGDLQLISNEGGYKLLVLISTDGLPYSQSYRGLLKVINYETAEEVNVNIRFRLERDPAEIEAERKERERQEEIRQKEIEIQKENRRIREIREARALAQAAEEKRQREARRYLPWFNPVISTLIFLLTVLNYSDGKGVDTLFMGRGTEGMVQIFGIYMLFGLFVSIVLGSGRRQCYLRNALVTILVLILVIGGIEGDFLIKRGQGANPDDYILCIGVNISSDWQISNKTTVDWEEIETLYLFTLIEDESSQSTRIDLLKRDYETFKSLGCS